MNPQAEVAHAAATDGRMALVTVVAPEGDAVGTKLLVREDGSRDGTLGSSELDSVAAQAAPELMWAERSELRAHGRTTLFVDVTTPAPRLVIFGAVDYGLSPAAIERVLGARGGAPAVRATYDGAPGHPVVLEAALVPELRGATGEHGRVRCCVWRACAR